MNLAFLRVLSPVGLAAVVTLLFSSCAVDQNAALFSAGDGSGSAVKKKTSTVDTAGESSWAEKMKEAREEREKARAEAEKVKEKELAAKKKEEEARARELAVEEKKAEAEKKLLAEKKAKEEAAKEAAAAKEREEHLAKKAEEARQREEARLAAKKKAEEERAARLAARREESNSREVEAVADRSGGGGFFSRLSIGTPNQYKSEGHDIFVNQRLIGALNPSNAKIEVSLSEQRARVYLREGGGEQLVIDTAISSGKSGHATPTGSFRIQEKMVQKRSTLYGTWMSSSGATVSSSGDSRSRPYGASRFVGAEMPYWMRINGGIGMHVGYVPNYPASHGCIRVPSAIQPLIYSKVGVGTQVTVKR